MKRRRKKNPVPVLLLVGGAAAAAVAVTAIALKAKANVAFITTTTGLTVPTAPAGPTGTFTDAAALGAGDCLFAEVGVAGFALSGVPKGQQTPMRVTQSLGAGSPVVQALSLDPRAPQGVPVNVPVAAIIGAGDCSAL